MSFITSRRDVFVCDEWFTVTTYSSGWEYWTKRGTPTPHRLDGPADVPPPASSQYGRCFIDGELVGCRHDTPAFKRALLEYYTKRSKT